jgi:hypothetical protein
MQPVSAKDLTSELYQRQYLKGFSTRESMDLTAITKKPLKASTLPQRCLPYLKRRDWTRSEVEIQPIPFELNGTTKYLLPSDDLVWEKLVPIISLATKIFMESWNSPFVCSCFCLFMAFLS